VTALILVRNTGKEIKKRHEKLKSNLMTYFLHRLKISAILGFLIILPFIFMEVVNRWQYHEGFPVKLFIVLWLEPAALIMILMPVLQSIKNKESIFANPLILMIRIIFMTFIAIAWINVIIDQMPCFLGVPNCD